MRLLSRRIRGCRRNGDQAGTVRLVLIVAMAAATMAATASAQAVSMGSSPLAVAPKEWATDASINELKVINYEHSYLRYREHTKDAKGDHLRDVIESKDGAVARMIMKDGRPLTAEEDQWEHERLQAMLDSPLAYAKHEKGDATGKKTGADMIKLMPEAMIYTYAPGQPQRTDRVVHGDDLPEIVLDYKPNPAWTAPNMTADALTGLEGRLWIDAKTHYLTRMEGTVFRPVNFGLFLAHVYPGGKLTFEQTKASEQRWIFTRFTEKVEIRVLVKRLTEDTDIEAANFSTVPEMSYQDAIRMLWATPLPTK